MTFYKAYIYAKHSDGREVVLSLAARESMTGREMDIIDRTNQYESDGWEITDVKRLEENCGETVL